MPFEQLFPEFFWSSLCSFTARHTHSLTKPTHSLTHHTHAHAHDTHVQTQQGFCEGLWDGVVLCRLLNALSPGLAITAMKGDDPALPAVKSPETHMRTHNYKLFLCRGGTFHLGLGLLTTGLALLTSGLALLTAGLALLTTLFYSQDTT